MRNSIPFLSASRLFLLMSLAPVMAALLSILPSQARTTALSVKVAASGLLTVALFSFFGRDAHFLRDLVAVIAIGISAVSLLIATRFAARVAVEIPANPVDVGVAEAVRPQKGTWRKWLIRIGIVVGVLLVILLLLSVLGHPGNVKRLSSSALDSINSVAFSPYELYVASGSSDHTITLWEAGSGRSVRTFNGHADVVHSVVFSRDGKYLVSGGDDQRVKLWEVASGNEVRTFTGHTGWIRSVAFSPDGTRIASASTDKTIKVWYVSTGGEQRTLKGHTDRVDSIAYSPDGRYLASGSFDSTVKIWKMGKAGMDELFESIAPDAPRTLTGHQAGVLSVAYSPDGKYLASGSLDGTARLWDVSTGNNVMTFNPGGPLVSSVAFSPDGKYLATAGGGTEIKLWEVASGQEMRTLEDIDSYLSAIWHKLMGNRRWVDSIAFSGDGAYLATGEGNGVINVWNLAKQ